ncbi:MAG TPA: MFS transporter [Pseudomonadales bacterium]|nr:MFS transporter [Pseudomonadales bacterium]
MAGEREQPPVGGRYAKYVLFVLVIVYVFNFIDRQILSILAEDIKADLGITDSQIGFLYGTAFAVFYAVFGIPLGRLADVWVRRSLIALGLVFWSAMTTLSGTARGFTSLAIFRFGVGIGEASASPAAFSMLSDYFPPRLRATAISIYSSGIYIGAGIGIFLGGTIVDGWNGAWPDTSMAPFELKGWQAAFMAVGLPGVIMGLWVWTLREPKRGMSEGLVTEDHPAPFQAALEELCAVLPPLTLLALVRCGAGARGIALNLAGAAVVALCAWGLVVAFGDVPQWVALGIGVYATGSWAQTLAYRDPPAFLLIFRSKALRYALIGFPCISFVTYGIGFWGAPYFIRVHGASAGDVGLYLGLAAALGGWIGVTAGGSISDHFKARSPRARIWVGLFTALSSIPAALTVLYTDSLTVAYIANFIFSILSPMWVGCAATTANDLVLPRMRALSSSYYILMNTFIGLALGPYMIGRLSDGFAASGMESGDALRLAMTSALGIFVVVIVFLLLASRHVEADENTRLERARTVGEP